MLHIDKFDADTVPLKISRRKRRKSLQIYRFTSTSAHLPNYTRHTAHGNTQSAHMSSAIRHLMQSVFLPRLNSLYSKEHFRMGALLSSLRTRCITLRSRWSKFKCSSPPVRPGDSSSRHERLADIEEGESKAPRPRPKKRALLVGISYHDSTSPIWTPLDGPHVDIRLFQKLLVRAYFIHRSVVFFYGH